MLRGFHAQNLSASRRPAMNAKRFGAGKFGLASEPAVVRPVQEFCSIPISASDYFFSFWFD
jgi:hypothetical protein